MRPSHLPVVGIGSPAAAAPVSGPSLLSYPELVGMFTHAAGRIDDAAGHKRSQWAWGHESAPAGCADLHWWTYQGGVGVYGHYERFCVGADGWVRILGWTTTVDGAPVFLEIHTAEGPGQRFALVQPVGAYAFPVEGELRYAGDVVARYVGMQAWTPVGDGWSQHEVFRWRTDIGGAAAFQGVSLMRPRTMFASVSQTFIGWDGQVTHGAPLRTAVIWTW